MRQVTEQKISIYSFPQKSSEKNVYGLSGINLQLYEFYCRGKRGNDVQYLLEHPDYFTLNQYVYTDLVDVYAKYGIYFREGLREEFTVGIVAIPRDVFFSDVVALKAYLREKSTSVCEGISEVHFIAEVSEEEQKKFLDNMNASMREVYADLVEEFTFLNIYTGFIARKSVLGTLKDDPFFNKKHLVNMLQLLIKNDCLSERTDYNVIINAYDKLLDDCLQMASNDKDICFYFDEMDFNYENCALINAREKFANFYERYYPFIASYLKLHGVLCYVEEKSYWECSHGILELFSKENVYLSDYLESLRRPIMVGVLNYGKNGFHTIAKRNTYEPVNLSYRIKCVKVQENKDGECTRLQIKDDEVFNMHCDDRDISVLDIRDYYDLHTKDFKKGACESDMLFSFLSNIHTILEVTEVSLDVSNAIVFRMKDDIYAGLLEKINFKVTYDTSSLLKDYSHKGSVELDEVKYTTSLLDIRAYEDHAMIIGNPKILQRKLPNTSRGFLVPLLCHVAANINETCGLHYDDVGLLGIPTKACRGIAVNKLLKCGLPLKGLQNNFLTFFGGPHMYLGETVNGVRTPLKIDQNLWRQ